MRRLLNESIDEKANRIKIVQKKNACVDEVKIVIDNVLLVVVING